MVTAVYPGSFDPVTNGHLDLIKRASKIFDQVIVAVLVNDSKTPMFTMEERVSFLKEACKKYPNVSVEMFDGLTVDFAKKKHASILIRGLRAVTDFEEEMQLAQTNHYIEKNIETIFMATSLKYQFLSSSIVKSIASYGEDVSGLVPECVLHALHEKMKKSY